MAITRYENIAVNNVINSVNSVGEYTTSVEKWFDTRALVIETSNSLSISEKYRAYTKTIQFVINFTPNTKQVSMNEHLYSITWRNQDWRIDNAKETDDRQKVILFCYRNDPSVRV